MDYIRLYFKTAFRHAFGVIDLLSGFGAAAVPIIAHLLPNLAPKMESLVWQIPLWAAAAVVLVRLIMAPYWIWKGDQSQIEYLKDNIDHYNKAWDRTGKYDIPVRQAVQYIESYFERTETSDKKHDRYKRAAAKIRELGWENQIRIVGREYDDESRLYEDFSKAISAKFWVKNRLDIEVLQNPLNELPQTITDEKYDLDVEIQPQYGQIQINGETLKAMFSSSP